MAPMRRWAMQKPKAAMWKRGAGEQALKPDISPMPGSEVIVQLASVHIMTLFLCVRTAPLGRPVVPAVYMMNATSSSSTRIRGSSSGCSDSRVS